MVYNEKETVKAESNRRIRMSYRDNEAYKKLEQIISDAGVQIIYSEVPDDPIDGAIWARTESDANVIMMPDAETFPDDETACLILGHEMGHILSGLGSPDVPSVRRKNEAVCDLIGVYLVELAMMQAEHEAEERLRNS